MCCRYLVESRWFKQWKKYVGFDTWDMFGAGDPNLFPGPVDNAGLFPGPIDNSGLFGGECCGQRGRASGSPGELPALLSLSEPNAGEDRRPYRPVPAGTGRALLLWECCCLFVSWQYVCGSGEVKVLFDVLLSAVCLLLDPETQSLKEHLIDELDYVLVPTEAWNKLVAWYGCIDGQQPIVRKVSTAESTSPPGFIF